ncbi:DUF2752 domain-containing protein [Streptomyces sp. NPDC057702]|uniref:DUF2752 domain-containing protein n=1 Tax=unclassified Streptomyces TaxID=2593676 RepID=UPI0036847C4A
MSAPPRPSRPRAAAAPRRLLAPLGVLAGVLSAFAVVAAVDPHEPGHYPACPLLQYTGVLCPGCGGLRGAHALAHGDLVAALGANALAVLGYVAFVALWTRWFVRAAAGPGAPGPPGTPRRAAGRLRGGLERLREGRYLWSAVGLTVLVFTLVRNVPFGAALAP